MLMIYEYDFEFRSSKIVMEKDFCELMFEPKDENSPDELGWKNEMGTFSKKVSFSS